MSAAFDQRLLWFYNENWDKARAEWANHTEEVTNALLDYQAGNYNLALGHLINAAFKTDNARLALLLTYQYSYPRYHIIKLFEMLDDRLDVLEAAPPPTTTMASILNAMLAAKFDELEKFIGIEDAYRCALWEAPFNVDFYAALARGFKKW